MEVKCDCPSLKFWRRISCPVKLREKRFMTNTVLPFSTKIAKQLMRTTDSSNQNNFRAASMCNVLHLLISILFLNLVVQVIRKVRQAMNQNAFLGETSTPVKLNEHCKRLIRPAPFL